MEENKSYEEHSRQKDDDYDVVPPQSTRPQHQNYYSLELVDSTVRTKELIPWAVAIPNIDDAGGSCTSTI